MELLALTEEETKLITAAWRAKKCEYRKWYNSQLDRDTGNARKKQSKRILRHPASILARNVQRHFSHHQRLRSISQSVGSEAQEAKILHYAEC